MKNLNKNFRKKSLIIINLFLILTLMTVSVYSWFAVHVDNRVDAYDVQVHADSDLELSFDGTNWSNSLNIENYIVKDLAVTKRLNMVEITSDGSTSFYKPQLNQKPNYAEVSLTGNWTPAEENKDFLQLKIKMRSVDELNVYLSSDSVAVPNASVLTGADSDNISELGEFSKDCVVGALRVGFINATDNKPVVWITNPKFHLNNVVGTKEFTMHVNETPTAYPPDSDSFDWNNPLEHWYYAKNAQDNFELLTFPSEYTFYQLPETVSSVDDDASKTLLTTLTRANANDTYCEGEVTINVWIEGCDNEARKALVGGEFHLSLAFDSYPVPKN